MDVGEYIVPVPYVKQVKVGVPCIMLCFYVLDLIALRFLVYLQRRVAQVNLKRLYFFPLFYNDCQIWDMDIG